MLGRGLEHAERVLDDRARDPGRGAADLGVAALERRPATGREVRHDHRGGDHCDDDPGGEDQETRAPPAVPERVPEPEHRDDEPDLLLRQAGGARAESEREQPVLVQEPDRGEQERRRERDGVEVVDDEPLRRRVEQVDEGEREPGPLPAEVLAREPEDGERTERDAYGLYHKEQLRARPDPPEWRKQGHDRVEMGSEAGDLVTLEVGHLEEAAVGRRPDGLGEVADVEAPRPEGALLQHGQRRHPGRERGDGDPQQDARPGHDDAIARSTSSRHRAPRTASLACAS